MKIVILSDTHGNQALAARILEEVHDVDHIIHLGDEIDDACFLEMVYGKEIIKVPGNCDYSASFPRERHITLAGKKTLITHGDLYNVKSGMEKLQEKAKAEKVEFVLYGHTHQASVQTIDDILFVNPGCLKKGFSELTYAILSIENESFSAEIIPAPFPFK